MEGIDEYIWRQRIHHGVRYQKSAVPFPESVAIGLEFNAALERKEPLDLRLLTNAVMLELCDFARTVTRSESYFFFEMLEFNFDLGVDAADEQQCYDYGKRVHSKVKTLRDQIKLKPRRWKEPFLLPDLVKVVAALRPGRYYPKRNKLVDSSVLSDGRRSAETTGSAETDPITEKFVMRKRGRISAGAYPFCKELGVTLTVRPGDDAHKDRLPPDRATNGAMLELLDFSRVLCGTHTGIVVDLVLHNFGHQMDKTLFRLHVVKATERKNTCLNAEDREAFRKEPFQVHTQKREQKRKRISDADDREPEGLAVAGKRREAPRQEDGEDLHVDGDLSYMCPVEFETDAQSDLEAGPEEVTVVVKEEEEEVFVSPQTAAPGPRPPPVGPQNAVSDLFSEDGREDVGARPQSRKLWTRRAARCKQILKSSRGNDPFARCRERGLDFNVAAASRRNLHRQLLTNWVLWEVCKFATAMTKSLRSFLFEILDNNFNLLLQDELHQRNFIFYMITKEKVLRSDPDRRKEEFLECLFEFPEVYNMVDVTGDFQTGQEAETDSDPPASAASQDPHPFCKRIGLDLWSAEERPASQKLDLAVFTVGAVLEVFSFVRELCGSVRQIVNDVLEHNFDVDLQSGATEASQVIHSWYATQKSVMKGQTASPKINRWLNTVVPLNGLAPLDPRPPETGGGSEGPAAEPEEKVHSYRVCQGIGLDLDVGFQREAKTKLDLRALTRGVLLEMHRYVERNCNRYVPALYEILDYNFDLSSHTDRKVEFAWAVASQVVAIAAKSGRTGGYLDRAVLLPGERSGSSRVWKEEPEDRDGEPEIHDDVEFVRELKPVDIEVEID